MTILTRAFDRDGEPVAVLVAEGLRDVARLVGLLAHGAHQHTDESRRLRAQVKRRNGGQAALRLLRDHGGPDFTGGRLTDDQLAPLSRDERVALPLQHHEPIAYSTGWWCRACWETRWPCPPAHTGARLLAMHLDLQVGA